MTQEIIVDKKKELRFMDTDKQSIGKTKKKISTPDIKKSRSAKQAHKDNRDNYRLGQDKYEKSPEGRKMHRKVGRANARRSMVNKAIQSVRGGKSAESALEAIVNPIYEDLEEVRMDFIDIFKTEAFFQGTRSRESVILTMAEKVQKAYESGEFTDREGLKEYMMSIV